MDTITISIGIPAHQSMTRAEDTANSRQVIYSTITIRSIFPIISMECA